MLLLWALQSSQSLHTPSSLRRLEMASYLALLSSSSQACLSLHTESRAFTSSPLQCPALSLCLLSSPACLFWSVSGSMFLSLPRNGFCLFASAFILSAPPPYWLSSVSKVTRRLSQLGTATWHNSHMTGLSCVWRGRAGEEMWEVAWQMSCTSCVDLTP